MIREQWRELIVPAALFATALLLAVPAALGPVRLNDSFWIDLVWLDQFARELADGVLYPTASDLLSSIIIRRWPSISPRPSRWWAPAHISPLSPPLRPRT
jgi:hypothetical protein